VIALTVARVEPPTRTGDHAARAEPDNAQSCRDHDGCKHYTSDRTGNDRGGRERRPKLRSAACLRLCGMHALAVARWARVVLETLDVV
jgi:hypothetical protein